MAISGFGRIIYVDVNTSFTQDHDPLMLVNVKALNNQIFNIFTTIPGERPFEPTFGSRIPYMLFDPIDDMTAYNIETEIFSAVTQWMGDRIQLDYAKSKVTPNMDISGFDADIYYVIKAQNFGVALQLQLVG